MKSLKFKNEMLSFNESRLIEKFLTEAKEDKEKFISKFGEEVFDRFNQLKQRLKNVKDADGNKVSVDLTYHTKHTSPEEMEELLNRAENREYEKGRKIRKGIGDETIPDPTNTKEMVVDDEDYTLWFITDVEDMMDVGGDAGWCIAGRYGYYNEPAGMVKPSQANQYFYDYINSANLKNSGYYVLVDKRDNDKYCILVSENDCINSVWSKRDVEVGDNDYDGLFREDYPSVGEYFDSIGVNIEKGGLSYEEIERATISHLENCCDEVNGYEFTVEVDSDLMNLLQCTEWGEQVYDLGTTLDLFENPGTYLVSEYLDDVDTASVWMIKALDRNGYKFNEEYTMDTTVEYILGKSALELMDDYISNYSIEEFDSQVNGLTVKGDSFYWTGRADVLIELVEWYVTDENYIDEDRVAYIIADDTLNSLKYLNSYGITTSDVFNSSYSSQAAIVSGMTGESFEVNLGGILQSLLKSIVSGVDREDILNYIATQWYEEFGDDSEFDLFIN